MLNMQLRRQRMMMLMQQQQQQQQQAAVAGGFSPPPNVTAPPGMDHPMAGPPMNQPGQQQQQPPYPYGGNYGEIHWRHRTALTDWQSGAEPALANRPNPAVQTLGVLGLSRSQNVCEGCLHALNLSRLCTLSIGLHSYRLRLGKFPQFIVL